MEDCIFCKIINGDLPAAKVYEDEHVLAFLDLSQVTKGHTLVIPKEHHKNIYDLPSQVAGHVYSVVPMLANSIKDAFQPIGLNLLNNNEEPAGQAVFHYHVHILPRYGKGDGFGAIWESHHEDYSSDDLQKIADEISKQLS
ncbi:HIT family protein [Alkalihalobacillus sp. AL-G]|uniref:HIT family protein n=1 Tax=Alkalihalobacillus sp. AL-G TaxID=2926399 RepID=UPI00272A5032|nr:HIT family protein [Alkalihalobacillus sp. AL-G]WLD94083.1 HIT family protein [Alkalihalobacillus sp. AL-G]